VSSIHTPVALITIRARHSISPPASSSRRRAPSIFPFPFLMKPAARV
jgi:hypothetical protein